MAGTRLPFSSMKWPPALSTQRWWRDMRACLAVVGVSFPSWLSAFFSGENSSSRSTSYTTKVLLDTQQHISTKTNTPMGRQHYKVWRLNAMLTCFKAEIVFLCKNVIRNYFEYQFLINYQAKILFCLLLECEELLFCLYCIIQNEVSLGFWTAGRKKQAMWRNWWRVVLYIKGKIIVEHFLVAALVLHLSIHRKQDRCYM